MGRIEMGVEVEGSRMGSEPPGEPAACGPAARSIPLSF
jgi:hypothetical protein